jgi:dihydroflavonol-4-reductase
MKRVFLTGGTGFIGQPLTKALLDSGWAVKVLVRNPETAQAKRLVELGAQCVQGDILDADSLHAGMAGADLVVHNAGWYELGLDAEGEKRMTDINVHGTEQVLLTALELNIPRTVYVSSVVYWGTSGREVWDETNSRQKPSGNFYEETKSEAHDIALKLQLEGLPLIIVCPSQVIGPNDHSAFGYFMRMYLNRVMPPMGWLPKVANTFVYVDDLANGIALAAQKGRTGETYLLVGDHMEKQQYLKIWTKRPGSARNLIYLPAWLVKIMFATMAPLLRRLGLPAFISTETVTGDVDRRFSSAKAQKELGWTYRSAEQMWLDTLDKEIALLKKREGQSLLQRLKPLE